MATLTESKKINLVHIKSKIVNLVRDTFKSQTSLHEILSHRFVCQRQHGKENTKKQNLSDIFQCFHFHLISSLKSNL